MKVLIFRLLRGGSAIVFWLSRAGVFLSQIFWALKKAQENKKFRILVNFFLFHDLSYSAEPSGFISSTWLL
jgi:type IV secretory pathway TrbL component